MLNPSTVHDDAMADTLTGGTGLDWFFLHDDLDTTKKDKLTDLKLDAGEIVTKI